jgi:hypothetical protein
MLDWRRFRVYLAEKYKVKTAYLFIGFIPERPFFREDQNASLPIPFGASTPTPVITIRL